MEKVKKGKKKVRAKSPAQAPKIVPEIDPNMPMNIVSNLFDALKGGSFILITKKEGHILTDRCKLDHVEFLGMLECAKIPDAAPRAAGRK